MPKCDLFYFNVYVNDKPLKEYTFDSELYVESDLHSEASYCIEEKDAEGNKQKYPVTPFYVDGFLNNTYNFPLYLKMCVDGHQIWMKPFPPRCRQGFRVNGCKNQHVVRELLFTLPRMDESSSPEKKKQRAYNKTDSKLEGTISMECLEARELGTYTTCATKFFESKSSELSACPNLCQSSKKHGNVGVSTREGRSLGHITQNHNKRKTMIKYQVGKDHFGGVVIKYRPRYMLQELGITDEAWKSNSITRQSSRKPNENEDINDSKSAEILPGKEEAEGSNGNQENTDPNANGTLDFTEKFRKMNCYSPTRSEPGDQEAQGSSVDDRRLFCLSPRAKQKLTVDSPSALKLPPKSPPDLQKSSKLSFFSPSDSNKMGKMDVNSPSDLLQKSFSRCVQFVKNEQDNENKQYRMIEIDDDIQILEEVDDDVIWMGDDSCCFLDVTDPDISMVDLSEDI
ncbi:uncharacterized protein LOC110456812 [Mizuhopecten yessoensis]|uniref:Uncharacterized protein n=1 Tax=Mizuhopecten yessoensis TaxID=6573 RepID=A0A210QA60_MIZYE|nr:uncharacterized protein LOC110456812 [Mizuhopecten yessoensis]OWF45612.1 hypothetical protein KP79_PYT01542 [Mizuhopecten yessoensis]